VTDWLQGVNVGGFDFGARALACSALLPSHRDPNTLSAIVAVVLPFFALIFVGYAAGRSRVLSDANVAGINAFVFYFALPAFLFLTLAQSPLRTAFDANFVYAYYGAGIVVYALVAGSSRAVAHAPVGVAAVQGLAASFPNVGYLGLPLVVGLFGEAAVLPAAIIVALDHLVLVAATLILLESNKSGGERLAAAAKVALASLVKNPLLIAIVAGVLVSVVGLPLPAPAAAFAKLLGAAAGPCALFALGATLAMRAGLKAVGDVAWLVGAKLVLHPFAVWIAVRYVFPVDPSWAAVAVIDAALPMAVGVYVVASQYGVYTERISTATVIATAASVVTVSALAALLAPA